MTTIALLDANVILRYIIPDDGTHSPQASALFLTIKSGERTVRISDTIIFETIYTLQSFYKASRSEIRDAILSFLDWPTVILPDKHLQHEALDRWVRERSISFADSYHLSLAKSLGLIEIISFDRKIEKDPAVRRVEP